MSRNKNSRGNRQWPSIAGWQQNNKQLKTDRYIDNIPAPILDQAYRRSLKTSPELHHPGITMGTAGSDHVRRDFLPFSAGFEAGFQVSQQEMRRTEQQTQGEEGSDTSTSNMYVVRLPNSVRDALPNVIRGVTSRAA